MSAQLIAPATSWEIKVTCDRCSTRAISMTCSGATSIIALASARDRIAAVDGWVSRTDGATGKTIDLCRSCDTLQRAGWQ